MGRSVHWQSLWPSQRLVVGHHRSYYGRHALDDLVGVPVPSPDRHRLGGNVDSGICSYCGEVITWRRTKGGRWQPYDLDGKVHFPTCRKRIAEGRARIRQWYADMDAAATEVDSSR